ncbi:tetratricopeptide repeat protein [Cyclobacterium roseum]|uniref:tetratricopeptide repeat protein n=1 Tax=Cyclobacterium roseum TaxID=2666137 RepID=UPI001391C7E1|nr:tetratricopeptide repeat protein [Cyclobacterium roseum]
MDKTIYFLLVFFLASGCLLGYSLSDQKVNPDSLRTLLDRSNELAYSQPERSFQYAKEAYEKAANNPALQSEAAQVLGYSYYDQRKLNLAETYFLEALKRSKAANLQALNEKNHHALYQLYRRMEDFEKARFHIDQALKYAELMENPHRLATNLKGLGQLYREIGLADKGINALHQALNVLKGSDGSLDFTLYIDCETSLALVYKDLEDYKSALEHLHEALILSEKHALPVQTLYAHLNLGLVFKKLADQEGAEGDSLYKRASYHNDKALAQASAQHREPERAIILNNMAFLAFELPDLGRADSLLAKSISIKEKIGNLRSLGYAYWLKGKILSAENQSKEALSTYRFALSYAQKGKDLPLQRDLMNDLAEEYFRLNDLSSYRHCLLQKEKLSDSLINIEKIKRIARSEFLFEQDSVLQANPYSTLWDVHPYPAIHWWLTGLALGSMILLVYFYHRLSIKEKLLSAFDNQLTESRKKHEKLKKKLLVYAENLANSDHKNKELMAQLERSSLAQARQEALESLSRFRISKKEDLRTFRMLIETVFPGYWERLKEELPDLTENEQMIASLFKLGYSTREMATVMGISYDGMKKARYRLKKKVLAKWGVPKTDPIADT